MSRSVLPRWWPLTGVLTLLTYNTWVLWSVLNGQRAIFLGYLSELSASDQPNHLFFRGGDLITAIIVGALGLRALRLWPLLSPPRVRWWRMGAGALVLFGVSTFLDAIFAMDCSPTLSTECKLLEDTGQLSLVHYTHTLTSVGAQIGIVASLVAVYIALRRAHVRIGRWQRLLLLGAVVEVAALTVMMAMLALGVPGLGYPQAVMVVISSLWFAAVGIALYRQDSSLSRPSPQRDDLYA